MALNEISDRIEDKEEFLQGVEYENSNITQQMLYLLYKDIEELRERVTTLEASIATQNEINEELIKKLEG